MTFITAAATEAHDGDAHAIGGSDPSAEAPSQPAHEHEDPVVQDTTMNAFLLSIDNANNDNEQVEVAQETEVGDTRISFEVHPLSFDDDALALPGDISDEQLNALGNATGNATVDVLRRLFFGVIGNN